MGRIKTRSLNLCFGVNDSLELKSEKKIQDAVAAAPRQAFPAELSNQQSPKKLILYRRHLVLHGVDGGANKRVQAFNLNRPEGPFVLFLEPPVDALPDA